MKINQTFQKSKYTLVAVAVTLAISACGPKKPVITQQQIMDARNAGTLEQLYSKVQTDLATSSGSSKQALTAIAQQIAQQLAVDKERAILQQIEDSRLPYGVAPLQTLESLKQEAEVVAGWDAERYQILSQKLNGEITQAQDQLARQLLEVNKIAVEDEVRRISALAVAARIAGEGSSHYQNYLQHKEQAVVNWMVQADTALAARQYTNAATFLRKVLSIDPENSEAKEKLSLAEQEGFEAAFQKALEDSKPELALSELIRVSASPMFESVKPSIAQNIETLNEYFINRALQQSAQGALNSAYKSFVKARQIRQIMGQPPQHDAEFDYLRKLMNFAQVMGQKKQYGDQMAYLEMVNQFNPDYPKLQGVLKQARQAVVEYAATSLWVQDFAQTGTEHSAGKSVAKQVYSWVFDKMPGDVALVSAQQLSSADASAPGRLLSLEGDVLQAGVDSESSTSKKTMRVVTESKKRPNPAYQEWKEDGGRGIAPPEFLVDEKKEDVSITVNYVRKTGILSVNYRLVDQKTGQVLINENARDKLVFEGEGNEGVSLGEFNLPFKRPELPSDLEIMEQLSEKVAQQIGNRLKAMLKDPDVRYESLGDKALEQKQINAAKNFYGFAAAIRGLKGGDMSQLREKLIDSVVNH
jgi:tetratricopeptide (TPR) repeat protein